MYKDVGRAGKRILAMVLSVCMILGLTDFSVLTVRAAGEADGTAATGAAATITAADIKYTPGMRFYYNGKEQKPTISIEKNGVVLKEGVDYSLDWTGVDTVKASANAKEIPITGINTIDYSWPGDLCAKYWISPRNLEKNQSSIAVNVSPQNLQQHQPVGPEGIIPQAAEVVVRDMGVLDQGGLGTLLTCAPDVPGMSYDAMDFTYTCENNTTTGTATIKIIGHNNYDGTISSTFIIRNNEFGVEAFIDDITPQEQAYQAKESYKPVLSIYTDANDKAGTALLAENYKVTYSEETGTNVTYPGTKIIKPGTYTALITGLLGYAGSTATKSYKVVKNITNYAGDITVKYKGADGIPDQPYTGSQITLNGLEVYDKGVLLTEGVDYRLSYDTNVTAGTGSVLVSGMDGSSYTGEKWFEFNITAGDLSAANDVEISVDDCPYTGDKQEPPVVVTFNNQVMTEGKDYTIVYSDNIEVGEASVTITGISYENGGTGNLKNSRTETFEILPKSLSKEDGGLAAGISVSGPNGYIYDGDKKIPDVTVTYTPNGAPIVLKSGKDYTITPTSSTAAGTVTVTITGMGNYTGAITRGFTISPANIKDLYDAGTVTVSGITAGQEFTYIGTEIRPTVTVKRGVNSLTSADYTLTYEANTDVGDAKVVITGKNNYTGTIEIPFKVVQKDINDTAVKYTPERADATYVYTFAEIEPVVKLEYQPSTVRYPLVVDRDYTVSFNNNVDRGTATITITGKGNYKGTRTETFTIAPLNLSDKGFQLKLPKTYYPCVIDAAGTIEPVDPTDVSKYGEAPTLVYVNKDGKEFTVPVGVYTLAASQNTAPGKGILTISAIEGSTSNFTGNTTGEFTIKGDLNDAKITINNPKKVYTGGEITLDAKDITVTYKGEELDLGTDYILPADGYSDNTEVSESGVMAKVTVAAADTGNYYTSGTIEEHFEIVKKNLNDESITGQKDDILLNVAAIADQEYTGSEIVPELTITYNGTALVKDSDYQVIPNAGTHSNNIDAGDAYITIEGMGSHFTGTLEIPFTITKRDISQGEIAIAGLDTERVYSGAEITLGDVLDVTFTGTCTDGTALTLNNDQLEYTVSYNVDKNQNGVVDNKEVGDATVVITGTGDNFTGSVEKSFRIKGDLAAYTDNTIIAVHTNKTYTGEVQVLAPEDIDVLYFGQKLEYGADYDIIYVGNKDASENVAFTVVTKGDYYMGQKDGGQDTENGTDVFVIAPKNINDENIIVTGMNTDGYTYTGEEIHPEDGADFKVTYAPAADKAELTLTKGAVEGEGDYTVTVQNAVNVVDLENESITDQQKPALVITAKEGGNYTGVRTVYFKINPQSVNVDGTIAKYQVTNDNPDGIAVSETLKIPYEGTAITLEDLVVSCNGKNLTASTEDENGNVSKNDYTLSYKDNNKVGMAHLVIEGHGNYSETKEIPFLITGDLSNEHTEVADIEAQPYTMGGAEPKVAITYYGQKLTESTDGVNGDYILSYTNNENVAKADSALPPTVTITGINGFAGTSISKTFEIVVRNLTTNPENMAVTGLNEKGYEYTGEQICPSPLGLTNNGQAVDPAQYDITYHNNINGADKDSKNPPYVRISGKYDEATGTGGNYTGYMDVPFTITGISLADTGRITVEPVADQMYTGKKLEPEAVVKCKNKDGSTITLKRDKDYKLFWSNNIDVSAGKTEVPTIKIEGINNFSGEREVTFKIVPQNMETYKKEFTVTASSKIYTGSAIIPAVQVRNSSKKLLVEGKDYTVSAGTNNINVGTGATVVVNGIGNYTGKLTGTFEIKPMSIIDAAVKVTGVTDKVYNSKAQTQTPTITWGDITLKASDYSLTYNGNISTGTATMTIAGKGNYTGTRKVTFKITPYTLKEGDKAVVVADIPNEVYTGTGLTPKPVITYRDTVQGINYKMVAGKDYTLTYKDNNVVGKDVATVTIIGKGNFNGSLKKTFTIVGNIALATVKPIPAQNYTGEALTPDPVVIQAGKTLVKDRDYTLRYAKNIEAGIATVTIKGMGDEYGGSKTVTFQIMRDISKDLEVVGLSPSYTYTGKSITPSLGKVSIAGKILRKNADYRVSFSNNKNVGTATMKITGTGYYKGSKSYNFKISRRSIAQCKVATISDKVYNGDTKKPQITIKYGSITLKEGKDYKLVYLNNKLPGRASVIISGKGNYNGNKLTGFDIKLSKAKGLKATALSTSRIKLSWIKKSGVTGYQVVDKENRIVARIKGSSKTSYTISGLKAGSTYYYKVRAYLIKGGRTYYSDFTELIKTAPKPSTPQIKVKSSKSKQAVVSWKKVSGVSGYEIYRKTKNGGSYKKVVSTTNTSYTNMKLTSKKTYGFRVRAYKNVNGKKIYSSYSDLKYVTIK